MAGIFSKIRTIGLSNLHGLLDKAIDLNSVGAVEQHIRDLENARKDLQGTLAEAKYDLQTAQTNLTAHKTNSQKTEQNIKTLLAANGNAPTTEQQASARLLAGNLSKLRAQISDEESQCTDKQSVVTKLEDAVTKVLDRENQMKSQLGSLRSQVATASAKTKAAAALEAVGSAVEAGGSIDGLADKIGRKNARADAQLDQVLGQLPETSNPADTDAILAEFAPKT